MYKYHLELQGSCDDGNVTGMGYRFKYHFYGLVVEADFHSDVGRVVDLFVKLSNVHRG